MGGRVLHALIVIGVIAKTAAAQPSDAAKNLAQSYGTKRASLGSLLAAAR
jgi:hypothetical protein